MERGDSYFVNQARLGQKDAFGVLVDRHRDVVFSVCLGWCGNSADAQDLTQEAFIRAYTSLRLLRDGEKFPSWLNRIAYAACMDWFRDRKTVWLPLDDAMDVRPAMPSIEDELFRSETRQMVADAMARLPHDAKLIASLYYLCGYSCEEIGQMMGSGVSAIKMRLLRARTQLKKYLRSPDEADADRPGRSLTRKILSRLTSFEKEEVFSHMRALKAVLEFHGERVDWDYLLGASGEAFSIYFSPSWCYQAKFVHSWDVATAACAAYGYDARWHIGGAFNDSIAFIADSLKHGRPVLAPGINPAVGEKGGCESHFWFVVNGVDQERERLNLSGVGEQDSTVPYPCRISGSDRTMGWHGIVRCLDVYPGFLARCPAFAVSASPSRPQTDDAVASLRRAARYATEPALDVKDGQMVRFFGGISAIEKWRDALRETLDQDLRGYRPDISSSLRHYDEVMLGVTTRLENSRRAASSYVNGIAECNPDLCGSDLLAAANQYEAVANAARRLFELYFDPQEVLDHQRAWSRYPKPKYFYCDEFRRVRETFSQRFLENPAQRVAGIEILDEVIADEKAAVKALEGVM